MNKVLAGILIGILFLLYLTLFFGLYGLAISYLWKLFIVPVFHLPLLNIPQSVGLGLLCTMVVKPYQIQEEDEWQSIIRNLIRPLIFMLFGYMTTLFM